MRLGDNTYPLTAVPVTEGWQAVVTAWRDKYRPDYPELVDGFPDMAEAAATVAVFRLERG